MTGIPEITVTFEDTGSVCENEGEHLETSLNLLRYTDDYSGGIVVAGLRHLCED